MRFLATKQSREARENIRKLSDYAPITHQLSVVQSIHNSNGRVMKQDALIGRQLANYRIERLIGRGGMASVYFGWDVKLDRPVAIKTIDVLTRNVSYAERLVHEAQIIAKWRHENIVQVYYADQLDGLYYFAMEYIDGLDLGELMTLYTSAGEMIPYADVVRLGRAIANALDFAHTQGVIHRDVKPSNVLLSADGRVVLTDFGLALDVERGSKGYVLGTPQYVAPEQAHSSDQTVPQSDLYSLGVILYEMLTGKVPFDDPSPMSVALKHITEPPPLPTGINPRLNIATEAVLLKALSKQPTDRYSTGHILMEALAAAVQPMLNRPSSDLMRMPVALSITQYMKTKTAPIAPAPVEIDPSALTPSPVSTQHTKANSRQAGGRQKWIALAIAAGVGLVLITIVGLLLSRSAKTESPTDSTPAASTQAEVRTTGAPVLGDTAQTPAAPTQNPASAETTPTGIETPIATPLQSSTPPPTILYPDGYPIVLWYTSDGFYLYNPGSKPIETGLFSFDALDSANGLPIGYRFEGKIWAQFYPYIEGGKCANIEIFTPGASASRPAICWNFNAMRTPEETSPEIFWLPREGVTHFRVLWDGQEIARCEVSGGICEIYLPQ